MERRRKRFHTRQMFCLLVIACSLCATPVKARGIKSATEMRIQDWLRSIKEQKILYREKQDEERNLRPFQENKRMQDPGSGNPCQTMRMKYTKTEIYRNSELKELAKSHVIVPSLQTLMVTSCTRDGVEASSRVTAGCFRMMDCVTHTAKMTFFYKRIGKGCEDWATREEHVPVGCQCRLAY